MKTTKRKLLGQGYIWFSKSGGTEYTYVTLYTERHGGGDHAPISIGELGAWQKVKLYAEYTKDKRRR